MTGVFYHDSSNRWAAKIGYKHSKVGKRTDAFFYFNGPHAPEPPADIITDATNKKREWKEIKKNWETIQPLLERSNELDGTKLDYSKPVWYSRQLIQDLTREPDADELAELREAEKADAEYIATEAIETITTALDRGAVPENIVATMRALGVLPKGILAASRKVSIREAMIEYLVAQKERITRKMGDRTEIGTYNTSRNNLLLCLGCTIAKDWKQTTPLEKGTKPLLELDRSLTSLDNKDLEVIKNYWFDLPGNVGSSRTVKNYFGGLKTFLIWCDEQDDFGFAKPKRTTKILRVNGAKTTPVTEADYKLLKKVLTSAAERTKMYAILGMFCGFNQADICKMTVDEVSTIKGETYITGYRSKEDTEAKTESKIKTTHWIPPEIARIMQKNKAPKNEQNLYFLNRYGRPMFHEAIEGGKSNAVSKAWEKAMKAHNKDNPEKKAPTYKQLRKWGWNEIQRHVDPKIDNRCVGPVMGKRFSGQQGGGVQPSYEFEDYKPVIAAQKKWWKQIGTSLAI